MPNLYRGDDADRIADQEASFARLAERASKLHARASGPGAPRHVRLAITAADPVYGDYPYAGAPPVPAAYWIIFVDGYLDDESGMDGTPPDFENRQTMARFRAYNLVDAVVPVGAPVVVLQQNGAWWIIAPSTGDVLLGKWLGSSTPAAAGTTVWQRGAAQPIEIYGGAPGGETDTGVWLSVENYLGPILPSHYPSDFVLIGYNGTAWYVLGRPDEILLGQYIYSTGATKYWQPGATQTVEVFFGTPFGESDSSGWTAPGIPIAGVVNRWGMIPSSNFVLITYNRHNGEWYAIAPQGQALLCQYIPGDTGNVWGYGTQLGADSSGDTLQVYGGTTLGSESYQHITLSSGVQNYNDDIVSTTTIPNPWVWIATNGFTSDGNYTLNWYVVQDASEKPRMRCTAAYSSPSPITTSGGKLSWTNSDLIGFTTSDNINFLIPDNRKYLVTYGVSCTPGWTPTTQTSGAWPPASASSLGDSVQIRGLWWLSGSLQTALDVAVACGYTCMPNSVSGGALVGTAFGSQGSVQFVGQFMIESEEGSTFCVGLQPEIYQNQSGQAGPIIISHGWLNVAPFDQG
jgi:hypothetical protein